MNTKRIVSFLTIILLILALLPINSLAAEVETASDVEYVEGVIIIQYVENYDEKLKAKNEEELGLSLEKKLSKKGLGLYKLNKNKDVQKVAEQLNKKKDILFAEPDYILRATELPFDYFDELWGLDQLNDVDIDAPEAWTISEGAPEVIVAVIDTGVQIDHQDLAGQFVDGYDFYEGNTIVYDGPDDDHGTHVSGTIAAIKGNNGVVGVAPNIKIMPLKFLGPNGGSTSDAIAAINFARINNADIINASWGSFGKSKSLESAIKAFDGPFVAAAGNSGVNTDRRGYYPASYRSSNIVSVAAVDALGAKAYFSNYGKSSVDVGAPGVNILSTYPNETEDGFAYMDGTSMAAPHVAGTLALMMSVDPTLSTQEYIDILYSTTVPLDSLNNITKTGGMINAYNALLALGSPPVDEEPPLVTGTSPTNNATGVNANSNITITFDEDIFESDAFENITISGLTLEEFTRSINNNILTLSPETALVYNTTYTVTIPALAVEDGSGHKLVKEYIFNFTVENEPPPPTTTVQVVSSIQPANKSRNIPINTSIVIQFKIESPISSYEINNISFADKNLMPVEFIVDFTETQITLTPSQDLDLNMRYTITLSEGAFITTLNESSASYTSVFTTKRK